MIAKRFVGRGRERARIDAVLDGVGAGRGEVLLLCGEPGIGKTSLADSAAATAARRGFRVLWGRCWEAGGAPAYWPWPDLIGHLVQPAAPGGAPRLPALDDSEGGRRLLAELVPGLRAQPSGGPTSPGESSSPDDDRFRLWRAVGELIRQAAEVQPLLLVLDDLHAADHAALSLLLFVARQRRPIPVLLLGTYRDVEARMDPQTSELLSRIGQEGTTLALTRLDRAESAELVQARAGEVQPAVEAQIWASAGGNPLFVEEMLRLRDEQGEEAIAAGGVPPGVRDLIRGRLSRLPAGARAVLDLAAVAGDEVDPTLLAAAAELPQATISERLAEAARTGVLVEKGRGWRFGHALFREVLYRALGEGERRGHHGRIVAAIESLAAPGPVAEDRLGELAHHALEGPGAHIERAVEHALRAATRAQNLLAFDEAVQILGRAQAAVSAAGNPAAPRARVLLARGEARIRRGEAASGKADCREAAAIAAAIGEPELAARAALAYGRVFNFGHVDPVLVDLLEESLEALPPGDTPLRARLLARLGGALQPSVDVREPARVAREAIGIARRLGDRSTLLETLHDGLAALMDIAPAEEQKTLNLEAERLAADLGDRERLLRTHGRLALAHLALGEPQAADRRIAAFERLALDMKAAWASWRGGLLKAMRATMRGEFAEAQRLAAEARLTGRAANDAVIERLWATNHAGLLRAAERHDDMLAFEPEIETVMGEFQNGPAWVAACAALLHARLEDREQVAVYLDLLPDFFRPPVDNLFSIFFVAEAAAVAGPPDVAQRLYDRLVATPDHFVLLGASYFSWEGPTARLRGLLAGFLERWAEAEAHFEEARDRCRRLGARPYLARTTYEHGRMLLDRGRPEDRRRALDLVATARSEAAALGMSGLVHLADRRLAPAPASAPAARAGISFVSEGEYWAVGDGERIVRLKDSLGIRYLARLLRLPGQEIHVLDLVGARDPGEPSDLVDVGDSGELIDREAAERYRRRIEDLEDTVAEAEALGDPERGTRARAEMEALAAELSRAVGLGGRARRAGAAAERARSAVQRRIKHALVRIAEQAPELAAHLEGAIKTGTFCVYRPTAPTPS